QQRDLEHGLRLRFQLDRLAGTKRPGRAASQRRCHRAAGPLLHRPAMALAHEFLVPVGRRTGRTADRPAYRRTPALTGEAARTIALTSIALLCFSANSILCRLALAPELIGPGSFTTVRILSARHQPSP